MMHKIYIAVALSLAMSTEVERRTGMSMARVRRSPYMRFLLAFAVIILAGCAPHSSGVLKLGPDTFTTSASAAGARGGSSEARKIVLTEANEYCAQLGKEILVTNIGTATTNYQYGHGKAEITFRCLAKGDPQLQRPEFRQTPDVTIEDRRK